MAKIMLKKDNMQWRHLGGGMGHSSPKAEALPPLFAPLVRGGIKQKLSIFDKFLDFLLRTPPPQKIWRCH